MTRSLRRTAVLLTVMTALAAAAPLAAQAKDGADDPPQVQVEDAPNHG